MLSVGIIGGGISGLLTAYSLSRRGLRVQVFEASSRAGGWIESEKTDQHLAEWGPNTLMAGPEWLQVANDLNLKPLVSSSIHRGRYIWRNGRRQRLPASIASFLATDLISTSAKISILKDLFGFKRFQESDLNITNFISKAFHSDILESFVQPFVSGIYAGDVDHLSAAACFPRLWDAKQKTGSVIRGLLSGSRQKTKMISFQGGLQDIVSELCHFLGAKIYLNHACQKTTKTDDGWRVQTSQGEYSCSHLVMATPAMGTANLLGSTLSPQSLEFLRSIFYQRVMVWNTAFARPKNFESGFGCLIPRSEKLPLLGSLWSSEIFSRSFSANSIVSSQFFSGRTIPADPNEFLPLLCKILGTEVNALLWSKNRIYENAIPQFALEHRKKVMNLRQDLPKGVFLVGNYLDGVGLSQVIKTSQEAADLIIKQTS